MVEELFRVEKRLGWKLDDVHLRVRDCCCMLEFDVRRRVFRGNLELHRERGLVRSLLLLFLTIERWCVFGERRHEVGES